MNENKLPWAAIQDEYGNVGIANAEGEYVVEEIATSDPSDPDLIVKAVNSHDALVAALEACQIALRTHSPNVPEDEQGWTSYDEEAIEAATEALEQVK
tara:strand:+ start:1279 stop:1572 length:294 start_codon:yes stop_codon:yes gene_type:complete